MPAHPPTPTADTLYPVAQTTVTVHPPSSAAASPAVAPVLSDVTLSAALGSVGDTLTATPVYSTAGTAPVVPSFQWTRGGVDISGATASTYTLVGLDEGAVVRCRVPNATGPGGSTGPVTSSGLCQVRVYGIRRASIADPYPRTDSAFIQPDAPFTLLCWSAMTAAAGTRGVIMDAGFGGSTGNTGVAWQWDPTGPDKGQTPTARKGTSSAISGTATEFLIPGGDITAVEGLAWVRIGAGADMTKGEGGWGDPALGDWIAYDIIGGYDPPAGVGRCALFWRTNTSLEGDGEIIGAIAVGALDHSVIGSMAASRAAFIDGLEALKAAGNMLIWFAPTIDQLSGDEVIVEDRAGNYTLERTTDGASTTGLTAEGP